MEKYNTCVHSIAVGQNAVFVDAGCPRMSILKGYIVTTKKKCEECRSYKAKSKGERKGISDGKIN